MDNKKIIGFSIILIIILIFTFLPIYVYDSHPQGIPILAGLLIAGTVLAMAYLEVIDAKWKAAFPIIAALSFGLFAYKGCTGKISELQNNGVLVDGNATHQRTETTKRRGTSSTSKYVEYSFKASDGRKYYSSDYDVSEGSFSNVDIPIIYSSKYPSVSVVLNDEQKVKKYMKKDATVATAEAFIKIVNEPNRDSVFSYLRQLSPLWVKVQKVKPPTWAYRSSDATLEIDFETSQHALCTTSDDVQQRIKECFKEAGYIEELLTLEMDEAPLEESYQETKKLSVKDSIMRLINQENDREPKYYKLHNNKQGSDYKEILIFQNPTTGEAKYGFMLRTQYCFFLTGLQDREGFTSEDLQP